MFYCSVLAIANAAQCALLGVYRLDASNGPLGVCHTCPTSDLYFRQLLDIGFAGVHIRVLAVTV